MLQTDLTFLRPLVVSALQDDRRQWTVQGFGFLRTYFGPPAQPKRFRLNLWHTRFTVPNVSTIHDHPWDFTSVIVAGKFGNQRYGARGTSSQDSPTHHFTTIKTGEGGGLEKSEVRDVTLVPYHREHFVPGDVYGQKADEIHETLFADGTVTLNERVGDTEHARVFWPFGSNWVDAIPRVATRNEVSDTVLYSLREWF